MSKQSKIQIPNYIVRNENGIELSAIDFVLLLWLKKYSYLSGKKCEFEVDPKKLMCNMGIGDNRTLKKSLGELWQNGFLKEEIKKLPRGRPLVIKLDLSKLDSKSEFTQLPTGLMDRVDDIGHMGIRLLYLYESYINRNSTKVQFCFVGYRTIVDMLKCSTKTINLHNDILVKYKLLKITKHKLATEYEYDEHDALVYDKFNNHYEVRLENI